MFDRLTIICAYDNAETETVRRDLGIAANRVLEATDPERLAGRTVGPSRCSGRRRSATSRARTSSARAALSYSSDHRAAVASVGALLTNRAP
ncbi:hypothetical protein ACQEVF_58600 [Nonomuraea polychroma]|uniref:hypothetical protein n=1 Tax=Nonomuraea polychroma TaxID=46176 RepID=UPI003D94A58A